MQVVGGVNCDFFLVSFFSTKSTETVGGMNEIGGGREQRPPKDGQPARGTPRVFCLWKSFLNKLKIEWTLNDFFV